MHCTTICPSGNPAFESSLDSIDETGSQQDVLYDTIDPNSGPVDDLEHEIGAELPSALRRQNSKHSKGNFYFHNLHLAVKG